MNINKFMRKINFYAILAVIIAFCVQMLTYWGAKLFQNNLVHYNLETAFDKAFPLIPEFVIIYMGCYFFWIANYLIIANISREHCNRFMIGDWLGKILCFVFFVTLPTTNFRPELAGNDFCSLALQKVWDADSPYNLLPSAHCFISWMCFIGLRRQEKISLWYKIFSCFIAILIFISVMATKQHVALDIFSAVILAEFCYWISGKIYNGLLKKVVERQ